MRSVPCRTLVQRKQSVGAPPIRVLSMRRTRVTLTTTVSPLSSMRKRTGVTIPSLDVHEIISICLFKSFIARPPLYVRLLVLYKNIRSNSIGKSWIEIFFLKKTRSGRYKRKTVLSAGEFSVLRELDCSKRTFYTKRKDRSKKKIWIKIECMFESGEGKGRFDRFVCIKSLEFVHLQE